MPHIEPQLVPDEYYSAKDIDRLFAALEKRFEAKEVMRIQHAMEFLGLSRRQMDEMCRRGQLPHHTLDGLSGKLFLRSELISFIKEH